MNRFIGVRKYTLRLGDKRNFIKVAAVRWQVCTGTTKVFYSENIELPLRNSFTMLAIKLLKRFLAHFSKLCISNKISVMKKAGLIAGLSKCKVLSDYLPVRALATSATVTALALLPKLLRT